MKTGRLKRWLARAAAAGALAAGGALVWGSLEVRARVESEPRFDLSGWRLELGEVPAWAPAEMVEELLSVDIGGAAGEPLTVFTPRVLGRVRERLLDCPWIKGVPTLRLRYPGLPERAGRGSGAGAPAAEGRAPAALGGIELELDLRVPIAAVAAAGAFHLADRERVRVGPPLSPARVRELRLPTIVGAEARPRRPTPPGAAWEDRDVREGIEVARALIDGGILTEFPGHPAPSIDIANVGERARPGEPEVIVSFADLRLGWGRSPISPGARTLGVEEILRNLRMVLRGASSIPRGRLVLLYTSPLVAAELPPGPR